MCIYIFLHEPRFRIATVVMTVVSRFTFRDIVNLNFSAFCAVFLKSRKFCKQYGNLGEQTLFFCFYIFATRCNITQFIYFWQTALHVLGGISTHHQEHTTVFTVSGIYLSNRYCYLPLLWKSWNWFECGMGIVLICFGAVADSTHNCKYNCVCSWWWVEIPPETRRAVFQK